VKVSANSTLAHRARWLTCAPDPEGFILCAAPRTTWCSAVFPTKKAQMDHRLLHKKYLELDLVDGPAETTHEVIKWALKRSKDSVAVDYAKIRAKQILGRHLKAKGVVKLEGNLFS
jgi:hypothetical protein